MVACNASGEQLLQLNFYLNRSFTCCDASDTIITTYHFNCYTVSRYLRVSISTLLNLTAASTLSLRCLSTCCSFQQVHRAHLPNCTYASIITCPIDQITHETCTVLYSTVTETYTKHCTSAMQHRQRTKRTHKQKCRSLLMHL